MAVDIKPLGDRVLVQEMEEEETKEGGIIIPDSAKEKSQRAKVIALGTGKKDDDGNVIPFEMEEGDVVVTSKYGGTEIKLGSEEYKILNSSDILAKLGK